jgi:hypothetical protein
MKSFKPEDDEIAYRHFSDNARDLFIDEKLHDHCAYYFYDRLISRLGINVFVFDIDSCEFFEREEK